MPTIAHEGGVVQRRPSRSQAKTSRRPMSRIGGGVALAAPAGSECKRNNPQHWQTLVILLPLFHNPNDKGCRKPVAVFLFRRTIEDMCRMFSGFTITNAMGWYYDESRNSGLSDELVRFEVDGIFEGADLDALHEWKRQLRRRFKQEYIYMRLVASGVAI